MVGSVLTLVMTPIAAGAMSDEEFGLWLLLSSVVAVTGLFGLGIGPALVSTIASARAANRPIGPIVGPLQESGMPLPLQSPEEAPGRTTPMPARTAETRGSAVM